MNSKEQIENYPTKVRSEGSGRSSPVMERQSSTSPTFTSRLPRMKSQNTLREEKVENKVAPSRREADELDRSVGNSRYDGGREIKSEPASIASSAKKPRLNLTTNPSPSISSDLNSSTSSTNSESPKQNGSRSKSPPSTTPFPTSKSSRPRSGSSTVPLSQKEQLETKSLPTRTRAQTSNLQSKPKSKPNTTRLRNGSSIKRRDSTETGAQPSWALSEPLMFMEDLDEASAFGLNGRSPSATNLDNVVLPGMSCSNNQFSAESELIILFFSRRKSN